MFLGLFHLYDWLYQDRALPSLDQPTVKAFIDNRQTSLCVARDYANTRKHMKRNGPAALIAQITSIESGPRGCKVTIGHGQGNVPPSALASIDALALAEDCERDWRDLLTQHAIQVPA